MTEPHPVEMIKQNNDVYPPTFEVKFTDGQYKGVTETVSTVGILVILVLECLSCYF